MFERELSGLREEDVDNDALGGREQDLLDYLLLFVVAAVGADELHSRPRQRDVEDPRVGRVREVQPHDLAALGLERELRFTGDEHRVPEAAHRDVRRLGPAEGRDPPLLDEDVVERQEKLAVGRRPVIVLARDGEDVPVEAHLLAVVLADVRVVPVRAWIRHVHLVGKGFANRDRRLRLVRAVVTVLEPQSVPVHGRIDVAAVRDVDGDRRVLGHFQRRAGDGAVVGKHAHDVVPDLLPDWCDLEIELVAVGELHDFGAAARPAAPRSSSETRRCRCTRASCGRAWLPTLLRRALLPRRRPLRVGARARLVPSLLARPRFALR